MTAGSTWNGMTEQERRMMLQLAEFKQETIDKYAPLRWSEIEPCYRPTFARVMFAEEAL